MTTAAFFVVLTAFRKSDGAQVTRHKGTDGNHWPFMLNGTTT
jgi:hypothetical protein